jgi:hypothetical protein
MPVVARLVLPLALALVACACAFGFLASGEAEPPSSNAFRLIYGTVGVLCALSIVALWIRPRSRRHS